MSLFQRAWDRPVGERMRTGPHAGKPTWLRRGRTYELSVQYGLRCGKCFMWGWARTVHLDKHLTQPATHERWWCHPQEDGWVNEGNDCPNCEHCTTAEEMATYERKWRYDKAGRRY